MDLNDKIKQILVDKSISPSHFADEIGVQRSSISHILAGRNRPSLDIVQKIVRRYPDLGMEWILEDEPLPDLPSSLLAVAKKHNVDLPASPSTRNASDSPVRKDSSIDPAQPNPALPSEVSFTEKNVERILIFYTDGTFKQYIPAN